MSLLTDEDSCSIRVDWREDIGKCKYKILMTFRLGNTIALIKRHDVGP